MHSVARALAVFVCLLIAAPALATPDRGQWRGHGQTLQNISFSDAENLRELARHRFRALRQLFRSGRSGLPPIDASDLVFELPPPFHLPHPQGGAILYSTGGVTGYMNTLEAGSNENVVGSNDNVVPEPTTASLLGLGLVGLALRSRRRRSA